MIARIDCENCGIVKLSDAEYMYQLSQIDSVWKCPHCRFEADFLDDDDMPREWNGGIEPIVDRKDEKVVTQEMIDDLPF